MKRACQETEDWGPKDDDIQKDWKSKRNKLNRAFFKGKIDMNEAKEREILKRFSTNPENVESKTGQ